MPESNTNEFGHTFYPKYMYDKEGKPKIVNSAKEEDEYRKGSEGKKDEKPAEKPAEPKKEVGAIPPAPVNTPPWDNDKK